MTSLRVLNHAGEFAENIDVAQKLRLELILPALERADLLTLDFEGVTGATQSFIHALISDLFRKFGAEVLDRIVFKNCEITVQKIITLVADYMQEAEN